MLKVSFLRLDDYRMLLSLEGEVTWDQSKYKLQNAIDAVTGEYADVLIDVAKVTHMDSSSAGLLVLGGATGRLCGTTFRLVGLEDAQIDLMLLVKLITTFAEPPQFAHPKAA